MSDFDEYINSLRQLDQSELKVQLENFYSINYAVLQIYQGIDKQINTLLNAEQLNDKIGTTVLAQLNQQLDKLSKLKFKLSRIKPERLANTLKEEFAEQLAYIKEQMVLSEIDILIEHLDALLADNEQLFAQEQATLLQQQQAMADKQRADDVVKKQAEKEKQLQDEKYREANEVEQKWTQVENIGTIKAYKEYALVYPKSKYAALAIHRLEEIIEYERLQKVELARKAKEEERLKKEALELKAKEELERQEEGIFTDPRDGQKYPYKKIGSQVWMTVNLNFAMQGSYCYDNKDSNAATYGRLYTWEAALKAVPAGWHLPSDEEFDTLTQYIESQKGSGAIDPYLKSTSGWNSKGNGNDYFGFRGLPAGYRTSDGSFDGVGNYGGWWSSTAGDASHAWRRCLYYYGAYGYRGNVDKLYGFSVRVLRD